MPEQGVGVVYKRLLSHRPVVQNQVHYFVKEFEVSEVIRGSKACT